MINIIYDLVTTSSDEGFATIKWVLGCFYIANFVIYITFSFFER